jgi:hypothetical protein
MHVNANLMVQTCRLTVLQDNVHVQTGISCQILDANHVATLFPVVQIAHNHIKKQPFRPMEVLETPQAKCT